MVISCCGCASGCSKKGLNNEQEIDVTLDKTTHLNAGDVTIRDHYFHFDENAVYENPSDSFVEIGPHGSLYLQNYVPGISKVTVEAKHTTEYEGEFFLGTSSTPNSVEYFSLYSMTSSFVNMTPDRPYFSIHNRGDNNLLIDMVKIEGVKADTERALKNLVQVHDLHSKYDKNDPYRPYDVVPIDESKIPNNRIVKKIGPESYDMPGQYTYGYEVYSKVEDGELGKMLYSSTATLTIEGTQNNAEYNAIFHIPGGIATIPVLKNHKVTLTDSPAIVNFNWDSPYNDFQTPFYKDRHFYPVYSVVGLPVNKDGDGCYPITTTYSGLEKTFAMPDPVMHDGYKFGGWFLDEEFTKPYDPDGLYEGNVTLYANCIETEDNFRKVYYHDYDGELLDRVDYLPEGGEMTLPTYQEVGTKLTNKQELMYAVVMGSNSVEMLRAKGNYPACGNYNGDKLTSNLISDFAGDVHLYISTFELYDSGPANYTRIFVDADQNDVISGLAMPMKHEADDLVLPGRYIFISPKTYLHDYDIYANPKRGDQFFVTDEMNGYIMDQSSYTSISTYGYGNKSKEHAKPLGGILRHEGVIKVGRRAFFNRYGLKDTATYFPRNAREFDVESYANTMFNGYLFLPKTLTKIGKRAFVGSKNIQYVALPKTLKTVEKDAFALGEYDEQTSEFKNINNRILAQDQIIFYYEGTEEEYNRLDSATREEIENNALTILFNVKYNVRYGR